jgi:hypothetical protein
MILEKLLVFFLVILYSIIGLVHSCLSSNNLAQYKTYTISPSPNYPLSAPSTDTTSLTDGKYTTSYFWTKRTTVGWMNVKYVEILIDLGKETNISSISFDTARGKMADVNYPAHVYAFSGSDTDHFHYEGDIVKASENSPGNYQVKKFSLINMKAKGRYVLLEVIPNGTFVFCDEIEVNGSDDIKTIPALSVTSGSGSALSMEEARYFAEKLRRLNIEKKFLNDLAEDVRSSASSYPGIVAGILEIEKKNTAIMAITGTEAIENSILNLRAQLLRTQYPGRNSLIEVANPWSHVSPNQTLTGATLKNVSFIVPTGGYDNAAVIITNPTTVAQQVSMQVTLPEGAPDLTMDQVPFIKSAAMEFVADPLVPLNGSFKLKSGESRLLFLTAHGVQAGAWHGVMRIDAGGNLTSLPINIQVSKYALPENQTLNTVNWGYLDFEPVSDRRAEAVKDLFAHHTNVIVVPPTYLPIPVSPADPYFIKLENYLKMQQGASKVLLYAALDSGNRSSVGGKYQFMGAQWKVWFREWYEKVLLAADRAGFGSDRIYFYPYDEMKGDVIYQFEKFSSWARREIPGIKLYATLDNKKSLIALPYLDIAQIADREDMYPEALESKKEIWIYGTGYNTKSLSPYSYYRLMPWKAFYYGFKGVGFWNYSDTGWGENPGTAWDDFDGNRPDFAVIYEGDNGTIVSSRRWEGWRMGVEDYELLCMYAKSKGETAAKTLAKSILDNPNDTNKADEVRHKILFELSQ